MQVATDAKVGQMRGRSPANQILRRFRFLGTLIMWPFCDAALGKFDAELVLVFMFICEIMVLKFFETLDAVAEYIEKEENEKGVKYIRRSVAKSFGSESEFT